jgi:hypothetical protein
MSQTHDEASRWWKITRVLGFALLAVICPFAAAFMATPKSSPDRKPVPIDGQDA